MQGTGSERLSKQDIAALVCGSTNMTFEQETEKGELVFSGEGSSYFSVSKDITLSDLVVNLSTFFYSLGYQDGIDKKIEQVKEVLEIQDKKE